MSYTDDGLNAAAYGEGATAEQILCGEVAPPAEFLPLVQALLRMAAEATVRPSAEAACCHVLQTWAVLFTAPFLLPSANTAMQSFTPGLLELQPVPPSPVVAGGAAHSEQV